MWEGLGAGIIGAGASLAGGYFANKASEKSVKKQIQFQERTLREGITWRMKDMKRAGLNPILAVPQAPGIAPGASYQARNIGEGVGAALQQGAASGRMLKLMNQELKNAKMEEVKLAEQAWAAKAQGWNFHFQSELAKQRALTGAEKNLGDLDANSAKAVMAILKNAAGNKAYQGAILRKWILSGATAPGAKRGEK